MDAMRRVELTLDVTGRVPGLSGDLRLAATAFVPNDGDVDADSPVVVAFAGGTHSRDYYDVQLDGHPNYSTGEFFARHGTVFVSIDQLGTGDSSRPDPAALTFETATHASATAVQELVARLPEVAPAVPERPLLVGMGHGMGSLLLSMLQARHRVFGGVVLLGESNFHHQISDEMRHGLEARGFGLRREPGDGYPPGCPEGYIYLRPPRFPAWRHYLHWEDVPTEVMDRDDAAMTTAPPFAPTMLEPGVVQQAMATIDVPILLCFGDRDSSENPYLEPTACTGSADVTLVVLPRSGHAHVLASSREVLWRRVLGWLRSVRLSDHTLVAG